MDARVPGATFGDDDDDDGCAVARRTNRLRSFGIRLLRVLAVVGYFLEHLLARFVSLLLLTSLHRR